MSLLITGGTGFVGRRFLAQATAKRVIAVSRNADKAKSALGDDVHDVISWNPTKQDLDLSNEKAPVEQVVNLMGESIAEGRWTAAKKKRIYDSRILGTRRLVDSLIATGTPPKVFVSASAIGIYGDSGEEIVHEDHQSDSNFTGSLCHEWEAEALRLAEHGTRVVCLRIGIVLGAEGGALEKMLPIFRLGVGGRIGAGKQWVAWIHVDDLVSMINWSLESNVAGPVNATAPNPVRNSELTKQLAAAVNRPAFIPAPWFALRLALGEFANTLFFSQRVVPTVATDHGFKFKFPNLKSAIEEAV